MSKPSRSPAKMEIVGCSSIGSARRILSFLKRKRRAFLRGYPLEYLRFAAVVKALLANRAQQVLLHVSSVPAGVGSRSIFHVTAFRIKRCRHEVALEKRFSLKAKTALS